MRKTVGHKSLESTVAFFIAKIAPNESFWAIFVASFFSGDEPGDLV